MLLAPPSHCLVVPKVMTAAAAVVTPPKTVGAVTVMTVAEVLPGAV